MNFRLSNQYQDPEAYCHPSDKESAMEPIHNYFLDFFGDTVEYQYVGHYKEFIPHLPKVSLCLSFWADNVEGTIDIKDIEEYLASSPVLKHISMELVKPELFCPESEFWQVESITLIINNNTVPAFLRHFRGRQAFLRCYDRNTLDLIEFMNRSRTGEQCQKLEYLKIAIEFNNLPNELLNENGVKHIDAIKKSPMHTLPKRLQYGFFPYTNPIISHSYIDRETDNRVVSVSIQDESFCFGVWNKMEEEFLKMVK